MKKKIFAALVVIAVSFLVYFLFMQPPSEPGKCKGESRCFYGTIEKAVDGDTLEISGEIVRLALINTPEKQAGGYDAARQFVERMCPIGSDVVVDENDLQISRSHRRIIAVVHCGSNILNEELLKAGYAKILEDFCERSEFASEQWAKPYGCG